MGHFVQLIAQRADQFHGLGGIAFIHAGIVAPLVLFWLSGMMTINSNETNITSLSPRRARFVSLGAVFGAGSGIACHSSGGFPTLRTAGGGVVRFAAQPPKLFKASRRLSPSARLWGERFRAYARSLKWGPSPENGAGCGGHFPPTDVAARLFFGRDSRDRLRSSAFQATSGLTTIPGLGTELEPPAGDLQGDHPYVVRLQRGGPRQQRRFLRV